MAELEPTPQEVVSFDRLPQYNVRPGGEGTDNPYGFDNGGYLDNQMRQGADVGIVGRYVQRVALIVRSDADRFEAAVAAIEAGPVSSVDGKSGAVVLNLDPRLDEALWLAFTQ